MDVLARHFSKEQTIEGAGQAAQPGLVDCDMAVSEWILLRSLMSAAHRGMNCEQFVSSLFAKHANVFPALCVVASAAAALPVTNASPERGFFNPKPDFDKAAEPTFGRNRRPAHENFYRMPADQPDGLPYFRD